MSRVREVHLAKSDADIRRCFSVMVRLRSHLTPDVFVEQVKRQTKDGYMLAYVEENDAVSGCWFQDDGNAATRTVPLRR